MMTISFYSWRPCMKHCLYACRKQQFYIIVFNRSFWNRIYFCTNISCDEANLNQSTSEMKWAIVIECHSKIKINHRTSLSVRSLCVHKLQTLWPIYWNLYEKFHLDTIHRFRAILVPAKVCGMMPVYSMSLLSLFCINGQGWSICV